MHLFNFFSFFFVSFLDGFRKKTSTTFPSPTPPPKKFEESLIHVFIYESFFFSFELM